jgi:hypothetical protein
MGSRPAAAPAAATSDKPSPMARFVTAIREANTQAAAQHVTSAAAEVRK